jgi:hypothetical protein
MAMHNFHTASALEHSKVDPVNGVIHGVSIITAGIQARGHDLEVDATTLRQMKECADAMGTVSVKWNHKSGADAVAGYLKNFWIEGNKLKGDWHLLKSHGQFEQAIELAERMPKNVGLSAAFLGDDEIRKDGKNTKTFARCSELLSVDLVAQPAANPDGMFEAALDGKTLSSVDTKPNHQMANQDQNPGATSESTLADVMAAINGLSQRLEAQEQATSEITSHLSQEQDQGLTVEEALQLSREEIQDLLDRGLIDENDANEIVSLQAEAAGEGDAPEGEGAEGEGSEGEGEAAPATATALSRLSKQVKELSARFEREDAAAESAQIEKQFSTIEQNMETLATENEALRFALKTGGARAITPAVSVRMFESKADKQHEFESLISEKVAAGKSKAEAVRLSAKEAPGLYQDYLAGRGIIRMES